VGETADKLCRFASYAGAVNPAVRLRAQTKEERRVRRNQLSIRSATERSIRAAFDRPTVVYRGRSVDHERRVRRPVYWRRDDRSAGRRARDERRVLEKRERGLSKLPDNNNDGIGVGVLGARQETSERLVGRPVGGTTSGSACVSTRQSESCRRRELQRRYPLR